MYYVNLTEVIITNHLFYYPTVKLENAIIQEVNRFCYLENSIACNDKCTLDKTKIITLANQFHW